MQGLPELFLAGGVVIIPDTVKGFPETRIGTNADHEGPQDDALFLESPGDQAGIPFAGFHPVGYQQDDVPAVAAWGKVRGGQFQGMGDGGGPLGVDKAHLLPYARGIAGGKGNLKFCIVAILGGHRTLVAVYPECHFHVGDLLQAVHHFQQDLPGDIDLTVPFPLGGHGIGSIKNKKDPGFGRVAGLLVLSPKDRCHED